MGHCSRHPGAERRRFFELKRYVCPDRVFRGVAANAPPKADTVRRVDASRHVGFATKADNRQTIAMSPRCEDSELIHWSRLVVIRTLGAAAAKVMARAGRECDQP